MSARLQLFVFFKFVYVYFHGGRKKTLSDLKICQGVCASIKMRRVLHQELRLQKSVKIWLVFISFFCEFF